MFIIQNQFIIHKHVSSSKKNKIIICNVTLNENRFELKKVNISRDHKNIVLDRKFFYEKVSMR